MTFDVMSAWPIHYNFGGWRHVYEAFCICRHCKRSTTFKIYQTDGEISELLSSEGPFAIDQTLNPHFEVNGFICIRDLGADEPPEHVPEPVAAAFREGATSLATECWNAAGAMFRLTIDLATKPLLPNEGEDVAGLNAKVRRDLGLRLPWLFKNNRLPSDLQELSSCVREDGNDGAHTGTLTKPEAQDLLDFTRALLERMYTQSERLRLATKRREQRRAQ
jgi:hypothetical protein